MMGFLTKGFIATLSLLVFLTGPQASAAEVNFKGKTIQFIVGSRASGGTGVLARLIGDMLGSHLPGKPDIVFRNMPGGGGILALNYFAKKVKPDGFTILTAGATAIAPGTLRKKAVRYDPRDFIMWGGFPSGGSVFAVNKDAAVRIMDKSLKPVIMGGINGRRVSAQMAVWGPEYLGWNLRWVVGFPGSSALMLALERGEIHAVAQANDNRLRRVKELGNFVYLAQAGLTTEKGLVERPDFKGVPLFAGLIEPKLKPEGKKAFAAWKALLQVGKWYALPKGTPANVVNTYKAAWERMKKDPKFIKGVKLRFTVNYTTISGKGMDRIVARVAATTDEDLAYIESLRKKVGIPVGIVMVKAVAKLQEIKRGARVVTFKVKGKIHSVKVSRSRTDVSIGGKVVARKKLKAGMSCVITYPGNKKEAKSIICK